MKGGGGAIGGAPSAMGGGDMSGIGGATCAMATGWSVSHATVTNAMKYFIEITFRASCDVGSEYFQSCDLSLGSGFVFLRNPRQAETGYVCSL